MRISLFASLALVAVTACSKDSGSTETPTSPGGTNNPAYNIAPDTALAVQSRRGVHPAGRREGDLNGQPAPNITVAWSATSGNGVVTQAYVGHRCLGLREEYLAHQRHRAGQRAHGGDHRHRVRHLPGDRPRRSGSQSRPCNEGLLSDRQRLEHAAHRAGDGQRRQPGSGQSRLRGRRQAAVSP